APGAPTPASEQVLEAVTGLNVRTGPGTSYTRIGTIRPGTTYAIVGEQFGWYAINFEGQTGYVSGQYVRVSQAHPPAPSARYTRRRGTPGAVPGPTGRSRPRPEHGRTGLARPGPRYTTGRQHG